MDDDRPGRRGHALTRRGAAGVRRVAVLSGGVGGARFLRGLVEATDPAGVTVIGNVGDDVEVLGLHVSPDLDSVLYALAGVADDERGWGRADETWHAIGEVGAGSAARRGFGSATATSGVHLVRTQALATRRAAVGGHARGSPTRSASAPRCFPRPTTALRTWVDTPGRLVRVPGVVRRARATGTRSTACASRAKPTHDPLPGSSRRSQAPS